MNLKKNLKKTPVEYDSVTLHKNLDFFALEAYKLFRANLTFMLPAGGEKKCPVIGVTSSLRGEGKSTTSVNLSYVLAEAGNKVLLMDADMRLPSIGKKLNIPNAPGLSNALAQSADLSVCIKPSGVLDNWQVFSAGDIPPNPSELLASAKLKNLLATLKQEYDYIVLDLPPVNIVSDAVCVSSALDGLAIVVRENYSDRGEIRECIRQLRLANAHILGVVMTGVGANSGKSYYKGKGHYGGKYYKKYGYENAEDTDTTAKDSGKPKGTSGDTKSV